MSDPAATMAPGAPALPSALMPAIVLMLAVAQIVTAGFPSITGLGEPVYVRAEAVRTAMTPAGWAFSIWGVIYGGCLALSVHQMRPSRWKTAHWARARGWMALAFGVNTAWQVIVALSGLTLVSAVIIYGLALAACLAVRAVQDGHRAMSPAPGPAMRAVTVFALALLAGWAAAAGAVGLPSALVQEGLMPASAFAGGIAPLAIIGLAAVNGAAVLAATRGELASLAALLWGLGAVAAANATRTDWADAERPAILIAGLALAGFMLWLRRAKAA